MATVVSVAQRAAVAEPLGGLSSPLIPASTTIGSHGAARAVEQVALWVRRGQPRPAHLAERPTLTTLGPRSARVEAAVPFTDKLALQV